MKKKDKVATSVTKRIKKVKRKQEVIKRFKQSRFNYKQFIKDYYLENNNAYISVKVDNINDIISSYSINGYEWLNQDFANYINENAYYIPIEYNIILEICGTFTKEQKTIINKTIKAYYGIKLGDSEIDLKNNKRKGNLLLLFGLFSLIVVFLVSHYFTEITVTEPLFILLWFFLWEYFDEMFITRRELKEKRLDSAQLSNIKIIFNEEYNNVQE